MKISKNYRVFQLILHRSSSRDNPVTVTVTRTVMTNVENRSLCCLSVCQHPHCFRCALHSNWNSNASCAHCMYAVLTAFNVKCLKSFTCTLFLGTVFDSDDDAACVLEWKNFILRGDNEIRCLTFASLSRDCAETHALERKSSEC